MLQRIKYLVTVMNFLALKLFTSHSWGSIFYCLKPVMDEWMEVLKDRQGEIGQAQINYTSIF
jgi:hypothetical protein